MSSLRLTVVTPVFNEQEVISGFYTRTRAVLNTLADCECRILFVVDKCTDHTLRELQAISRIDPQARVIAMSSRFGHQMSLLAGIENSLDSDAIVMMDCDLQHPPELIPTLLDEFRKGAEVVYTVRNHADATSWARRAAGRAFYFVLGRLSRVPISENAADFRLISRRVATILVSEFSERTLFLRGIFAWMGFSQREVVYSAESRPAGASKYSLSRLLQFASAGILSFSTRPLQIGIILGASFAGVAFLYLLYLIANFFLDRSVPSGWTTLAVLLLLFSGVQLMVLGIVGLYVGNIHEEVKRRPRYIIEEKINF